MKVAAGAPAALPATDYVTLTNAKTIRVVCVGAANIDDAGTNKITITVGGQVVDIELSDLDPNGVGIAHLRGALCSDNLAGYALGGTATVGGVYLELVDGVKR